MTKDWENYKGTILALYEHQTLSQVMEIMERDYNFSASTRAYRQKLDKWGKRKYKKRKGKSDNSSEASDVDSADEADESSISTSLSEVSHRKGGTHAYQRQQQQQHSAGTGSGADAATFQAGDASYSLNHSGTDISNNYSPAQYQNTNTYGATDNTYWESYSATAAQSYSQAPLGPNAAAYGYGGMLYHTDSTAAAPYQYMDASGASYPMDNQMDYTTTYPGGSWDQTQDG
ncbi:hypothetical protein PG993_004987 [Apiospora rasikravindrae]|uniref:Clr5 domain-containing protein n=1 Tax=Apiospora rasikravindrae TaxID=990691 RepID=A0ABR1TED5_9PEZI